LLQQSFEFAMDTQRVGTDKFYHPSLSKSIRHKSLECFYTAGDESICGSIIDNFTEVERCLKKFYEVDYFPFVVIYIYHDLQVLNEAFKRKLPNDQCCFVPIKGDVSLVTFTSKIGESSVKPILAHELSHVIFSFVSGNKEINNIQQTIPLWLDEGVAMYIDKEYRVNFVEVEQKRANILKRHDVDYFPRLSLLYTYFNRLDEPIEFGPKGMMAYAYSYFCVLDLINSFGITTVVNFIKNLKNTRFDFGKIFEMYFDLSVEEFDDKVKRMVLCDH